MVGFSIINHPFWGTPIFGNTHIWLIFDGKLVNIPFVWWIGLLKKPSLEGMPWREVYKSTLIIGLQCVFGFTLPFQLRYPKWRHIWKERHVFLKRSCLVSMLNLGEYTQILLYNMSILCMIYFIYTAPVVEYFHNNKKTWSGTKH